MDGLQNDKQKRHQTVEEFYEQIMTTVNKLNPRPSDDIIKNWFQNGLRKEYATYIELLASDTKLEHVHKQ